VVEKEGKSKVKADDQNEQDTDESSISDKKIPTNKADSEATGEMTKSSSPVASLNYANPSALPGKEKAQMMNATCGAKCYEQFKKLNRDSSSLKMSLVSRILMADWYSSKCALTWKMKGTKFSRLLFQLQPKTLRIAETDAGLLPTPTAMMDEAPIEKVDARNQKQMEKGNSPFILGLGQQAMRGMLPTPNASDWNTGTKPETYEARRQRHAEKGVNLQMSLRQMIMLPTPTVMDSTNATATMKSTQVKQGSMHSVTLTRAMAMGMLPTPTASDVEGGISNPNQISQKNGRFVRTSNNTGTEFGAKLRDVAGMLLTPSASDGLRSGMTMDSLKRHNKVNAENSNLAEQIAHKVGGGTSHLNPRFVAEMMGFPVNWTELPFLNGEQKV